MSLKYLLISPPKIGIRMFMESPPIGLGYVATALRRLGHTPEIKDCLVDNWDNNRLVNYINDTHPDAIGVNVFSTALQSTKNLISAVRKLNYHPLIIVGGPHASGAPEHILTYLTEADFAFKGEAEIPLMEFEEYKQGKRNIRAVAGLIYRDNGKIKVNANIEYRNIEEFGFPAWDLIDPRKYFKQVNVGDKSINVHFSRGCPFQCLSGNTMIKTLDGEFKIKDLVNKQKVKVLTRDKITGEPIFANAYNISKTRKNAKVVRVHFTDGTYIDCTPDHKFMGFKNGNQFVEVEEKEIEAQDLRPKQSVRAIKFTKSGQYLVVNQINHKVSHVEQLPYTEDTYCMEVPGYDWFYANNVLVHNCKFCVKLGKVVRWRSLEHIWEETLMLNKDYGVERFIINDEGFTMFPEFVKKFCRHTISQGNRFRFFTATGLRLNRVDDEMLTLMKQANFERSFGVGIESAVPRVRQDLMNKHLTQEELEKGLEILNRNGYKPVGNFILGFPGETKKELIQSVKWACRSKWLHGANFVPFLPLPGGEATEKMLQSGELPKDFDFTQINLSRVVYAPKGMTINELDKYRAWAVWKYNSSPRMIWHYISDWGRCKRAIVTFLRIFLPNWLLPKDWRRK